MLSQRSDSVDPSKPDAVYAQIDPGREPDAAEGRCLYANVPSNSKNDSGDVVYSDRHSTDVAANSVATTSDL